MTSSGSWAPTSVPGLNVFDELDAYIHHRQPDLRPAFDRLRTELAPAPGQDVQQYLTERQSRPALTSGSRPTSQPLHYAHKGESIAMHLPPVVFGFGAHSHLAERDDLIDLALLADRAGLDIFSLSDHPYLGTRIDAYAALGFILGRTRRLAGFANVTSLPTRPAPMLARTVTSLSALTGGRVVLGMGAGGMWGRIRSGHGGHRDAGAHRRDRRRRPSDARPVHRGHGRAGERALDGPGHLSGAVPRMSRPADDLAVPDPAPADASVHPGIAVPSPRDADDVVPDRQVQRWMADGGAVLPHDE